MLLLGLGEGGAQKASPALKELRCGVSQSLMAGSLVSHKSPAVGLLALRGTFSEMFSPSPVTLRGSPSKGSPMCTVS